jgi:hypothetical protein
VNRANGYEVIFLVLFLVGVTAALASSVESQRPRPIPASEWTYDAHTWAARMCHAEAAFRLDDCTEMLWVVTRRWDGSSRPWLAVMRNYSVPMHVHPRSMSPRKREIRSYPWGDVPGKSDRFNRRWMAQRMHVIQWAMGKHPSKYPDAVHWGGDMDTPSSALVALPNQGTANTFYRLRKKAQND